MYTSTTINAASPMSSMNPDSKQIAWKVQNNSPESVDILGRWHVSGWFDSREVFDTHFTDDDLRGLFDAFLDAADLATLDYLAYRTMEAQQQAIDATWNNHPSQGAHAPSTTDIDPA